MKKILSVIVVAALGWVAFDRVSLALELQSESVASYDAARAANKARDLAEAALGDANRTNDALSAAYRAENDARRAENDAWRAVNDAKKAYYEAQRVGDPDAIFFARHNVADTFGALHDVRSAQKSALEAQKSALEAHKAHENFLANNDDARKADVRVRADAVVARAAARDAKAAEKDAYAACHRATIMAALAVAALAAALAVAIHLNRKTPTA